jgi:hypothetical protein
MAGTNNIIPASMTRAILPRLAAAALSLFLCACSSTPLSPYTEDPASLALQAGVDDGRGRFREIFCAILDERAATLPDSRTCDDALTRLGSEPEGTGRVVDLGISEKRLVGVVVPGLGWGCFANWLNLEGSVAAHVRQFGFDLITLEVDALSSSSTNARQVRDGIMAIESDSTEPHLVLIGYSKGAPDILEAIVSYPEIRSRIAAVIGAAGAVGGSPAAEKVTQSKLELLRHWPGAECSVGDGGGIESLRPEPRKSWLAENPLPQDLRYYSLVTCPHPDRISAFLKSGYKKLRRLDERNDGMVLFDDQFIPQSTFIGCVNADHWAVAVPVARTHPNIASLFVNHNDYPREALVEALLRYVEEDLTRSAAEAP